LWQRRQAYLRTNRKEEGEREKAIAEKLRVEEQARQAAVARADHSPKDEPAPGESTRQP
jgi:hypothetical protein